MQLQRLSRGGRYISVCSAVAISLILFHIITKSDYSTTSSLHTSITSRDVERTKSNAIINSRPQSKASRLSHGRRHLSPRAPSEPILPASDAEYKKAEDRGTRLVCWMESPSQAGDLATSKWTKFEQLEDWGWSGFGGQPISKAITINYGGERDVGIRSLVGSQTPNGKTVRLEHKKTRESVTEGGKTFDYPATGAEYINNYYPDKGVIVGDYNWGPNHFINDGIKGWNPGTSRKPALFQLSDIWYLSWAEITKNDPSQRISLRAVVQHNVVNTPTQSVIARVLQIHWPNDPEAKNGRAPGWPGKRIEKGMEGFEAILGTNNIWGVPYMLIQRSGAEALGRKRVKGLVIWNEHPDRPFYQPNVIIELENTS